jgi:hypothetical protein
MTSNWTSPSTITQYSESEAENLHISWDNINSNPISISVDRLALITKGTLTHISRSPRTDLVNKTYYVRFSGFNFQNLPNSISGIEVRLTADRRGRITDETIQLSKNQLLIGENLANLDLSPIKTYGGDSIRWGLNDLTIADIIDPTFGITLRFQSHPLWPHNDGARIDSMEIRIH